MDLPENYHEEKRLALRGAGPTNDHEFGGLPRSLRFNPEMRTAGAVVLDLSGSMNETPINNGIPTVAPITEINNAMIRMKEEFARNRFAAERIILSIVTFGSEVKVAMKMTPASEFNPPTFTAGGMTPMAEAGLLMLSELGNIASYLNRMGVEVTPFAVLLISDGRPTSSPDMLAEMTRVFTAMHRKNLIHPIIVGTETADMEILEQLFQVKPIRLCSLRMSELFQWYSQSLQTVSMSCVSPDEFSFADPSKSNWSKKDM